MVLNALSMHGVQAPPEPGSVWRTPKPAYWVQDNVVNSSCAASNCSHANCIGASLDEASRALECVEGIAVSTHHARNGTLSSAADLSSLLQRTLGREGAHVIVNFVGPPMRLTHYGHYSPCVAYHPPTDSALVLDVSRYKYPAYWVPTE